MTYTNVLSAPASYLNGGSRPAPAARPVVATATTAPVEGAGFLAGWWLIQGLVLGAVGGGAVSGIVIGSVLGLRHLIGG